MEKAEKFWDRLAGNFDQMSENSEPTLLESVENARRYLRAEDVVLDFGCATGEIALDIALIVKEVQGIDISSKMIEIARRKAAERRIENAHFNQSNIFDEGLSIQSFDAILAFNIFHLLEDIPRVMQRLHNLLKPGGLLISSTGCMGEKKSVVNGLIIFLTKIIGLHHIKLFKVPELKEAIEIENFHILESKILKGNLTVCHLVAKKI